MINRNQNNLHCVSDFVGLSLQQNLCGAVCIVSTPSLTDRWGTEKQAKGKQAEGKTYC